MAYIQLGLFFNDKLGLKSVRIDHNDTGLPDDSKLLERVAFTLLKAIRINEDSVKVQDLLNELGIERSE